MFELIPIRRIVQVALLVPWTLVAGCLLSERSASVDETMSEPQNVIDTQMAGVTVRPESDTAPANEELFPHRAKYEHLEFISTQDLRNIYEHAIVFDVRSKLEHDVIHINGAILNSLSDEKFIEKIEKIRSRRNLDRPIVFYCNGHTCSKSYKAGDKAHGAGFENVYIYDSGVFEWAKAYPNLATLLDVSPVDKSRLISKEDFQRRVITADEFKVLANGENTRVIDVRDAFQRKELAPFNNVVMLPLNDIIPILRMKSYREKRILICDAVGKQTKWLQYYLEFFGYQEYYFLEGGVNSIRQASLDATNS